MIKRLNQKSIVRAQLNKTEEVTTGFRELIADLSNIASQWNDYVYPTIASLPNNGLKYTANNRSTAINPVTNGLDGSQLYLDMAATPQIYNGLLHNGSRPKTIKEVLLDSYQNLFARVERLADLLDDINAGAADYDDTTLRNWILQLAGDTVSGLAQGGTYNAANFDNAPLKQVEFSLHQRDVNLRNVVGVEGQGYGYTDVSPLFAATEYLVAQKDIIAALIALDGAIDAADTPTLQDTYNNGNGTIIIAAGPKVVGLTGLTETTDTLQIYGGLALACDIDAGGTTVGGRLASEYNDIGGGTFEYAVKMYQGSGTQTADAADKTLELHTQTNNELTSLRLGHKDLDPQGGIDYTAKILGGYRRATDGGGYRWYLGDESSSEVRLNSEFHFSIYAPSTEIDSGILRIDIDDIYTGNDDRGVIFRDSGDNSEEGSIYGIKNAYYTGAGEESGLKATFGSLALTKRAPFGAGKGGNPNLYELYQEGIIKTKGNIKVTDPSYLATYVVAFPGRNLNIDTISTDWDTMTGEILLKLMTPFANPDDMTIVGGINAATADYNWAVTSISEGNPGSGNYDKVTILVEEAGAPPVSDFTFYLNIT